MGIGGRFLQIAVLAAAAGPLAAQDAEEPGRAQCERATDLIQAGRTAEALALLRSLEGKVPPGDLWYWWGTLGVAHTKLGHDAEAMRCLDEAIKAKPDCWFRKDRAFLHHLAGRWDEALADLDAAGAVPGGDVNAEWNKRLRLVVEGPFRVFWPHAWKKLEARSKLGNYHVVSNVGTSEEKMNALEAAAAKLDPKDRAGAQQLGKLLAPDPSLVGTATLLELVRAEYMKVVRMKESEWPKGRVFKVFYFDSRGEFDGFVSRLGKQPDPAMVGFYDPNFHYLALFSHPGGKVAFGFSEQTLDTFCHEGFHQFFHVLAEDPPLWLNEGIAEFLGKSRVKDGGKGIELGLLVKHQPNSNVVTRYENVKSAMENGKTIPFRKWFRFTDADWRTGDEFQHYAQAWAVLYYAMRDQNRAFTEDFLKLFRGIVDGKPYDALLSELFPDEELDAYEKAWLEYLKKL